MSKNKPHNISLAKVTPPRLPKVVERQRLFKELDRAREYPIIWITAPPGMGKTTLIANYLRGRKLNPLWYQIDEGDADPATLFQYLRIAATTIGRRKKDLLPHLTPEYLPSLPTFTRRFFETLYARLKSSYAIVLDNFQQLPTDAPTQNLIALACETVPPGINLYVLSRSPPPPLFAKLLADRFIALIDSHSLLLTLDETVAMCRLQTPLTIKTTLKTRAEHIHQRTNGWIAGTILLLESEQRNDDGPTDTIQASDVVFHYLAREVFETFSPEVRQILLKTAFFPSISPEMAKIITGLHHAPALLHNLYRSRSFVERHRTPTEFYRYHPLFQEFLQILVHEQMTHVEYQVLLQQTAQLLEVSGQPEEAMKLWQINDDHEKIIKLILTQAPTLVYQGRIQILRQWIEELPADTFEQEPWLLYWRAICQFPFSPLEAKQGFIQAFESFLSLQNQEGQLFSFCGVVQAITNLWQDLSELDPWLEQLQTFLPNLELEQLPVKLRASLASTMVQALIWRRPQDPTMDKWIEQISNNLGNLQDDFQRGLLFFNLTTFFCIRGQQLRARQLLQDYPLPSANKNKPVERILFLLSEAHTDWYCGRFEEGHKLAEQAYSLVSKHQAWLHAGSFWFAHQVYHGLTNNKISEAQLAIQEMKPLVSKLPGVINAHFHFMAGWVAVTEKSFSRALDHLQKGLEQVLAIGVPFPEGDLHLSIADVLLEFNEHEKAVIHIVKGLNIGNQMRSPLLQFRGRLLEARLCLDQGRNKDYFLALQKGMGVARKFQIEVTSFWRPEVMAKLCTQALKHDIEKDYVRNLIRKRDLTPEEPPLAIPHWPWLVKITTLGHFSIVIDDQPLEWSRKAQRRPLLFLKALIAQGCQDVPETTLSDTLWPDAEGDAAHQAFATTLHRVRRLLKYDKAILLQDKKVSLDLRYCWVDTFTFEYLLQQSKTSEAQGDIQEACQLREQAFELYQGSFLREESEESWAFRLRDRLRTTFIRAIITFANGLEKKGKIDKATQWIEQSVNIEPLSEPLYQTLIRLLRSAGRDLEAAAFAQRLERDLKEQLGIEKGSMQPTGTSFL